MWFSIVLAAIIAYIFQTYYNSLRAIFLTRKVTGLPALPIIGSAFYFLNKTSAEIFQIGSGFTEQYGSFFKFWFGAELNVVLQDPKDIEIILSSVKYIDKATHYDFVKSWLNNGLLTSTGKEWHSRRKIITPAFHFRILGKFVDTFDRLGNTFIKIINEHDAERSIELFPIVTRYTLDVMCETAMGVSINAMAKPNSDYVKAVKKITHVLHMRMINLMLRHPTIFKYSKLKVEEMDALHVLNGFTDDIIRKRRRELIENNRANDKQPENGKSQKELAFLDILLQSIVDGEVLTDLDIRDEVNTFMFEGHDTTASGITFCLYNIAKNPEVQRKCFDEILNSFGTDAKLTATLPLLNQLSYLELVIKESLRLYPSVPLLSRMAMEDIELTNGRIVPRGSCIVIPVYNIGRNANLFEFPNEFKPERFLYDDEKTMDKRHVFTYIPFSAGPRNCIGQKFAMLEMKCILSKVLRNFEISLAKDSETEPILSAELVLRPENAINFHLKRRN